MNKYYYIPVNSLNFNNILSSESISPVSFYEKRGFGFKRFDRINANPFQNSILAYNKVPLLSDIRSDREEYPLYVGVPEKYLSESYSSKSIDNIDIIQTDRSIYINWMECFFLTRTEEEKKKIIASTRRSIEVKNVDNYTNNIYVLEEFDIESFNWNESVIADLSDAKNSNQSEILRDQKINKFKGFVYAYASGKLKEQPEEMAEGSRYFQEFINSFSALMNDLSVLTRNYKAKKVKFDYTSTKKKIAHLVEITERIKFLFVAFEQSDIDNLIQKSFNADKNDIEILNKLQYQSTRINVYSLVSDFIKSRDNSLYTIDELLEVLIDNVNEFLDNSSLENYKSLNDNFDRYTSIINNKIRDYKSIIARENALDSINININEGLTEVKTTFNEISEDENLVYRLIVNEVLSRVELSSTDEIAQCRQGIIQNVATLVKSSKGEKHESVIFLRKLYKSLITVGVGFKINESEDNALKSLACFLSRYSEMEKLQDFMDRNKFYHYGLAFGIWGAAYGYANISKILMESLTSDDEKLSLVTRYINKTIFNQEIDQNGLKAYIETFGEKKPMPTKPKWKIDAERINREQSKENSIEEEQPSYETNQIKDYTKSSINKSEQLDIFQTPEQGEDTNSKGSVVVDPEIKNGRDSSNKLGFMDLIIQDDLIGKRPDWVSLIETSFNQFNEELKANPDMGIGSKKHEFERLLAEGKRLDKIKGFGAQKINEVIRIFITYIQSNE
ncbi:MAG: hypothetical protein K8F54_11750 [Altibacter sp.]|uniref:hypothetical protein n=1 Tax=Altibacter sp. TaxID=2024823 RepID=UPI001DB54DAB|nr:hypothetical protein [Altibacter sp.]MBZ0328273.1 hypothetical protein [Altibacter sp.]